LTSAGGLLITRPQIEMHPAAVAVLRQIDN
jgi:hypothetical protein